MSLFSLFMVYPERTWIQDCAALLGLSPIRCFLGFDRRRYSEWSGPRKRSSCMVSSWKTLIYRKIRLIYTRRWLFIIEGVVTM